MFNSSVLDVTLGLVVVFLLVSTVCTAIREGLESVLKTRAAYLERAIRELLCDPSGTGTARSFFQHPLINGLFRNTYSAERRSLPWLIAYGGHMPSYIPARNFARTVIDLAARGTGADPAGPITLESLRRSVRLLPDENLQRVMLTALDAARHDVEEVQRELEAWFDGAMERVSGWYKRTTQVIIFGIAACVVCALNLDTIALADALYHDQAVRGAAVAAAEQLKPEAGDSQVALKLLNGLHLPIGWSAPPRSFGEAVMKAMGLLLTTFAAMLGAPFWFDVLNKVTMIRGSLKPEDKRAEPAEGAGLQRTAAGAATALADVRLSGVTQPSNDNQALHEEDCGLHVEHPTPDDALPPARGGVAS